MPRMSEFERSSGPLESAPPPRKALPAWVLPVTAGLAGLILGMAAVGGAWGISIANAKAAHQAAAARAKAAAAKEADAKKSILKDALAECGLASGDDSDLADDGYTLTINGLGEEDYSGLSIDDEGCLLRNLKAPDAVISHIDQTTSMDGRQSETWRGITFSWSYHPDRGLDGVLSVEK